jgi:hypothetical protein
MIDRLPDNATVVCPPPTESACPSLTVTVQRSADLARNTTPLRRDRSLRCGQPRYRGSAFSLELPSLRTTAACERRCRWWSRHHGAVLAELGLVARLARLERLTRAPSARAVLGHARLVAIAVALGYRRPLRPNGRPRHGPNAPPPAPSTGQAAKPTKKHDCAVLRCATPSSVLPNIDRRPLGKFCPSGAFFDLVAQNAPMWQDGGRRCPLRLGIDFDDTYRRCLVRSRNYPLSAVDDARRLRMLSLGRG